MTWSSQRSGTAKRRRGLGIDPDLHLTTLSRNRSGGCQCVTRARRDETGSAALRGPTDGPRRPRAPVRAIRPLSWSGIGERVWVVWSLDSTVETGSAPVRLGPEPGLQLQRQPGALPGELWVELSLRSVVIVRPAVDSWSSVARGSFPNASGVNSCRELSVRADSTRRDWSP